MTVEAKLKITATLDQAVAALRQVGKAVEGLGSSAQQADSQGTLGKTRAAATALSGQLDGTRQKLQASGQAAKAADEAGTFGKTRAGLESISSKLEDMRTQFLAFLGLQQGTQAIAGIANMSDQYQSLRARLRLVTNGQEEFNTALRTTQGLSAKYNQPLNETASLYTRILSAVKPLNGGMREATVATEAMLASLKISGATTAEAGSAILQFSQAMGSGVLRGEEFNAINEAAPRLLDALAQGLGKPKSELKALAEQGALTTSAVVQALSKALPKLQQEAASIPDTIGGAYEQVKGKVQQFIGSNAEASGSAVSMIAVLKVLADNINTVMGLLQGLAALLLAGAIGRGAAGLVALGAGATGAATGVGILTVATRGLLALIGGPVGLVVTLAALAAGWLGLSAAKEAATKRTAEQARSEQAAVNAEIASIEAAYKRGEFGLNAKARYQQLQGDKKRLDAEVGKLDTIASDAARDAYRKSERDAAGKSAGADMLDPAGVKKFQDEYRTRTDIVKKFADERKNYLLAKDKEIEFAQKAGNTREVAKLQKEKSGALKEQAYKEKKDLQAYDTRDVTSRIAQAKVLYDKDFELLADATEREKRLVQERFDQGLLDLQTYLTEKARLQNAESNQAMDRLIAKQVEEERILAINKNRLKSAKTGNEKEQAQEAVTANQNKIVELTVEIEKGERKRLDTARELTNEARALAKELQDQQKTIETQIKQALGKESKVDIQRRVQDQMQPQLNKEFQGGGDGMHTQRLIDLTVLKETLAQAEREYARMLESIRNQEDAVRIEQEAGTLSIFEAERKVLAIRQAQLPALQAQVAEIGKISQGLGPDEKNKADQAKNNLKSMGDLRTDAEKTIRGSVSTGFGQFFNDIASGTKTVSQALRDMLGNFAKQILNMITQRLGAQLLESLMPAGGGGVGNGLVSAGLKFFGFHSGGVVGMEGSSFSRNVNAAAFAYAPRYHTGGIAGMAPRRSDEMYAVLQKGEEVLTADDPRHIKNRGTGGGGVAVNITVNGAQGDKATQGNGAADLGRMVESVVDQWAIKQSRPGGMLFGRSR